nr:MAG TPA: restriction alleviation protein [Caudoviricetes sp.]
MKDFDKTADELYQLCRRVQKETKNTVCFSITNYKNGVCLSIVICNGMFNGNYEASSQYGIVDGGYDEEENAIKAREHLNRLLIEKPCPYCEEDSHGE